MDTSNFVSSLTAIGALIVSLVAIGRLRVDSKKAEVDSKKASVDMSANVTMAASELVDDYREEVRILRERVAYLENKDSNNRRENMRLSLELAQARERVSVLEGVISVSEGEY